MTAVTKEQFAELFTFCDPVPRAGGHRYVSKKDLLTFLCKLRQGLSDELLKVIFNYSSRQSSSLAISVVRKSLMIRFVPQNIGFNAITRQNYIARHVTDFSNQLYNPDPAIPKVIAYADGAYAEIPKNSNFRILRQSFCFHKGHHLVKPVFIVAPDGYILDIQGPYFSDSRNNDAEILRNEFERDVDGMRAWFHDGDIFIFDRGYRDTVPWLERLGISCKMPPFLQRGQRWTTTEEANSARLIIKTRWIVEARNGHIQSIFKFFAGAMAMPHVSNIGDSYRIAGGLINRYRGHILMEGADAELGQALLERAREVNVVQARVEVENLHTRNARWIHLNHNQVVDFPHVTIDYLKNLTVGIHQVRLASSYIQDKLQREEVEVFELDTLAAEPGLIRVRLFSRFRNATKYQLWISYEVDNDIEDIEEEEDPILGYYCTCKSGARTLGTCAHIASVLWFLGYARHEQNVRYPSTSLLNTLLDAARRPQQQNLNNAPEIIEG